jgi:2,5-diamino-6-(ribosylamino)-4(3H)-pyrimidinone 5'-phosphate reductase
MVEGGAKVIKSFLAESESVVNTVIVTVAPIFVGQHGIGYELEQVSFEFFSGEFADIFKIPRCKHIRTEMIGRDTIIVMEFS